jgi:hypothetical protein
MWNQMQDQERRSRQSRQDPKGEDCRLPHPYPSLRSHRLLPSMPVPVMRIRVMRVLVCQLGVAMSM